MDLSAFSLAYAPQGPSKPPEALDAHRQLDAEDGMGRLPQFAESATTVTHPNSRDGRHLWVIVPSEVRAVLEIAPDVRPPPLSLGVAKHTNLTGGSPACCGGEMWFDAVEKGRVWANGGSGRYPPRSRQQLEDAMQVLRTLGFQVVSAGWSDENDCAERVFR